MSPRRLDGHVPGKVRDEMRRAALTFGTHVRGARLAKRWSVRDLAQRCGVSADLVYRVEAGHGASLEACARIAVALGRRAELTLIDPRKPADGRGNLAVDLVHSLMGEFEARHLRKVGYNVGVDEPYQHYQFAGRADVVAWHGERRALLHIENRTRFPDVQELAGAYNAKRAYLATSIGERMGIARWASETHVMAGLWSAEVLHAMRLRLDTFRSLCPDDATAWHGWWGGNPPTEGRASTLIVVDPLAAGRQRQFIGLDDVPTVRPRYRGYAEVARRLARRAA